ncbi:MAG: viral A-type inclusion protein [Niabella sp.]
MMRLILITVAVVCSVTMACNNPESGNNEPAKSLSDSLLQLVLDGHDVAMPKMMKLQRLQKEAAAEIDSLKKVPGNAHKVRIALLDSTIKSLDYADVAMNEWMEGFRYDSLKDNEPARVDYLKIQLEQVNKMKDIVLSSIEKADSVLAK